MKIASMQLPVILILLSLLLTPFSTASCNLRLSKTWGGTGNDEERDMVVDHSGNIYVTGSTNSFGAGDYDILLLKYDPSGSLLWSRTWGGLSADYGYGVAVDLSGSIYVVGYTNSFGFNAGMGFWYYLVLLKFASNGSLLWQRMHNQMTSSLDSMTGASLSIGLSGNIFVTSHDQSASIVILEYSRSGNLLLQGAYRAGANDWALEIVSGIHGELYLVGYDLNFTLGGDHLLIVKLNATDWGPLGPTVLWQETWSGDGADYGYGATLDLAGNLYVTGSTSSFGAGNSDAYLMKLNANGSQLWARTWGGSADDIARAVTTNLLGDVYVTGNSKSYGSSGPCNLNASCSNVFLLKFDSVGDLISPMIWGGSGTNFAYSIVTDVEGNPLVTGTVHEAPPYTLTSGNNTLGTPGFELHRPNGEQYGSFNTDLLVNGTVLSPLGSESYSGSDDLFLFSFENGPPQPPIALVASVAAGNVTLTWTPPQLNGGSLLRVYNIYRRSSDGYTLLGSVAGKKSFIDSGIRHGQTYYYRVTAVNDFGESAPSNEASAFVQSTSGTINTLTLEVFAALASALGIGGGLLAYRRRRKVQIHESPTT